MPRSTHPEIHRTDRIGWLRAAVLGANDGIVSTAGQLVGVAAANVGHGEWFVAGVAGLVAGAMSMAAGEYVSVSSQADTESADIAREREELRDQPDMEQRGLATPASHVVGRASATSLLFLIGLACCRRAPAGLRGQRAPAESCTGGRWRWR